MLIDYVIGKASGHSMLLVKFWEVKSYNGLLTVLNIPNLLIVQGSTVLQNILGIYHRKGLFFICYDKPAYVPLAYVRKKCRICYVLCRDSSKVIFLRCENILYFFY